MVVEQIYEFINGANAQLWGKDALKVNDLTGLVALGNSVMSSATDKEQYLGVLFDRIGKTILRNLNLEVEFPSFIRNEFEWGAVLNKIDIQPLTAQEQKAWDVGADDFEPNNFAVDKPKIYSRLFKGGKGAWEFHVTIPDIYLKSAFTSAEAYGAFIEGIMASMTDSMTQSFNSMAHACLTNLVAEKIKANNGIVNLLPLYNATLNSPITAEQARTDKECYRFSNMIMNNYLKYLEQPSVLFNTGIDGDAIVRATARDNMHVILSADYASAMRSYLLATDYNYTFSDFKYYDEFVTLQAEKDATHSTPSFATNTSINVKPSSGGEAIVQTGIVGIFADRQALGTYYEDVFSATDRNNRNRYTGYTSGATVGYFNDLSENAVIFLLADED